MLLLNQAGPTPKRNPDDTRRLVDAIAREMCSLHGAGGTLNWNAVERHLSHTVRQARTDLRALRAALVAAR